MISVMNGINNPASFGFSGSLMDTKPFYQKFAANASQIAAVGVTVSNASETSDRNTTPPALATRFFRIASY